MQIYETGAIVTHTAAAAGVTSSDIGLQANGLIIYVHVSAITGTSPTLTVTVQGKSPVSGQYYTILASAAITTTGLTVLRIHPALTAAANLTAADMPPPTLRVMTAIGGTTPAVTATISAAVIG